MKKKLYSVLTLTLIVMVLLVGCKDAVQNGANAVTEINAVLPMTTTDPAKSDSIVMKKLEELTNTKLKINWVPTTSYEDKVNIIIASNDMPHIIMLNRTNSIINAMRLGAFWDVGEYLKDYENLNKHNPTVLENTAVEGKHYMVYRSRPLGRNGMVFREDWLENLGMEIPQTIDEFYAVLKAFTYNDPDGNGVDDTFGMAMTNANTTFDNLAVWFGAPNKWGIGANGDLVPQILTPEYFEMVQFVKRLYDEKLINQDFPIVDSGKWNDYIINQKAGVIVDIAGRAISIDKKIRDVNPNAKMNAISGVAGPKGLRSLATTGHGGGLCIPKAAAPKEEDMRKVLSFLNRLEDSDVQNLLYYGLEGRQYTIEDDLVKMTSDTALLAEKNDLNQLIIGFSNNRLKVSQTPLEKMVDNLMTENENIVVSNPAESFISKVYAQSGGMLDTIYQDARIKYIVGKIDLAGYNSEIETWEARGGNDYIKEMNELYTEAKNR